MPLFDRLSVSLHLSYYQMALLVFCACMMIRITEPQAQSIVTPYTMSPDIDAIIQQMSLEEKVGQMFMVSFYGTPMNDEARHLIQIWQPGAVVLLPSNLNTPQGITALTNDIQMTLRAQDAPPALIAVDQEGGTISRLQEGFTTFPLPMILAATNHPTNAYNIGQAMAQELQAVGINMNLAPVADVNTNPQNPIINRRAFGSDPVQISPIIAAYVRGLQDAGVLATAKHFPGHGDTSTDSHIDLPILPHDRLRFERIEWVPFRAAIAVDVAAIMTGHLVAPALDSDNHPASLSLAMIDGILRGELGYDGIVMTDAMDMDAIDTQYSPAESAYRAIMAGNDLILLGAHISPDNLHITMQYIVDAVQSGDIPIARIETSVRRILRTKAQYGLLDWQPLEPSNASQRISLEAHTAQVQSLFRDALAIVRDDAGLLPLPADNILFIYPATRFSLWRECQADAELAGITLQPLAIPQSPDEQSIQLAQTAAQTADVIITFTLSAIDDPAQQRLVNALPPQRTIVIALQSPYDLTVLPYISTYLLAYSPLLIAHDGICQALISGDIHGHVVVDLLE